MQWRVVWDFTSPNNTCNEGWCETLHHQTIHAMKGGVRLYITKQYMQWRVVWDFTSPNNTCNEGWRETLHHQTIHALKGGVRLYITKQYMQWMVVWDSTSPNNTCMNGGVRLYIRWRREVVTKGSRVFADRIGMAAWLLSSGVAMRRDAGLLPDAAKRIVMAAWMLHGLCFWEEAGARNLVFFRVKWLQPAMKGTSCVWRVRLRSFRPQIGSSSVFCNEWLFLCA